jgi:hypothetical protein
LFGRAVVAGAQRAFGPPDERWHDEDRVNDEAGTSPRWEHTFGDFSDMNARFTTAHSSTTHARLCQATLAASFR